MAKIEKYNTLLRLRPILAEKVKEAALKDQRSFNEYVAHVLEKEVNKGEM